MATFAMPGFNLGDPANGLTLTSGTDRRFSASVLWSFVLVMVGLCQN